MDTKIFKEDQMDEAAACLRAGELVAFPTETVYGLGANALLEESVKQVFQVKGRPSDNPLILHVNDFDMVKKYVENFHPLTKKIVAEFWPGPLTLIFELKDKQLPKVVTGGLSTAAFRMPANQKTLLLIEKTGIPIVGPSANTSGKPSPTTAQHVYHDFVGKIAGIVDDGATKIGVESTVLDVSNPDQPPMILRPGAVTKERLEEYLGTEVLLDNHLVKEGEVPKAPGMKYKHYAPDTPVEMVHADDWPQVVEWASSHVVGVIGGPHIRRLFPADTHFFELKNDSVEAAAHGLFAGLRGLDDQGLDKIFVPAFPEKGLGAAYMNRLKKASSQIFFEK